MSDHAHQWGLDVQRELAPLARELRQAIPDVLKGFVEMHDAAMAPGAIDGKTKELIALAIGISQRCDGCIASHARGAFKKGATRAEVAETIGVAILMNGGPATVYGPRALAAYDDFATPAPSA
jgi:AhpD family alkylhydroperoxidase